MGAPLLDGHRRQRRLINFNDQLGSQPPDLSYEVSHGGRRLKLIIRLMLSLLLFSFPTVRPKFMWMNLPAPDLISPRRSVAEQFMCHDEIGSDYGGAGEWLFGIDFARWRRLPVDRHQYPTPWPSVQDGQGQAR